MQTIDKKIDCIGSRKMLRYWKKGHKKKNLGTSALDHTFSARNPSKSSKVSEDLDCSLVSNKNFSEILPSNGWCPGPGKVGQGGLKVLHF